MREVFSLLYHFKDTILDNRKVTLALSKTINYKFNADFLLNFDLNK